MNTVIQLLAQLAEKDIRLWLEDGKLRFSAPEGAMTADIRERIVASKNSIVEFLEQAQKQQLVRIALRDRSQPPVLSLAQQRLWFQYLLDPTSAALNIPFALRVQGTLDIAHLEAAFSTILQRHEVLRTTYRNHDGAAIAALLPAQPIRFVMLDSADEASAARHIAADMQQPFDLAQGVVRARLIRLAADHHILFGALHHIAGDGMSLSVLVAELAQLYHAFGSGAPSPLPALDIQYGDFAAWQHEQMGSGRFEAQINYWTQRLAGAPDLLKLPLDRPRPQTRSQHGAVLPVELSAAAARRLPDFCREHGVTSYMVLLTALNILLQRWGGQSDICITSPVAGRELRQVEPLIGFFVNSVIQRTDLGGNPTVAELLHQVQQSVVAAFDHQDVPFDQVIEALKLRRYNSFDPLQQVAFSLLRDSGGNKALTLDGLTVTPIAGEQDTAKVELTLALNESEGRVHGLLEYNTDLFDATTVALLAQHYSRIVDAMLANPAVNIGAIALTDDAGLLALLGINAGTAQAVLPLAAMQRDLYLDSLLRPDTIENSLGYCIELPTGLDQPRWQQALQWIDDQRDVLRTRFVRGDKPWLDVAYQIIAPPAPIHFTHHTLASADATALQAICLQPLEALGERMVRYGLVQAGARLFATFTTHHAVLDGKSLNQHLHDVVATYHALAQSQPLPVCRDRVAALVDFNRAHLDRRETLAFWRQQLADCETLATSQRKGSSDAVLEVQLLPASLWRDLGSLAQRHHSSNAAVIKSALALLVGMLHQPRGRFRVTEVLGGRFDGHHDTLGCYIQNLQFVYDAAQFGGAATLQQLLDYARQFKKSLGERQYLSVFALKHLAERPQIDYQYNYRDVGLAHNIDIDGTDCRLIWTTPAIRGVIQLVVTPLADSAELRLHYYRDESHGDENHDPQLLQRLQALLTQLVRGEQRLAALQWLDQSEQKQILTEFNFPLRELEPRTLAQVFTAQAARTPDATAVMDAQRRFSYRELDQLANRIANRLVSLGAQPGQFIGLCVSRSALMTAALLGVAKSGAAYAPLDPSYPAERIQFMLDDTGARLALCEREVADCLPASVTRVLLDDPTLLAQPDTAPAVTQSGSDVAYIIYTSGSTGLPKGVIVEHQALYHQFDAWIDTYRLHAGLVHLQMASMSFDVCTGDHIRTLGSGGALVICPKDVLLDPAELHRWLVDFDVTFAEFVPVVLRAVIEYCQHHGKDLAFLDYLIVGSDAWFGRDHAQARALCGPQTRFINSYGVTEATVDSTWFESDIAPDHDGMVPVGRPFPQNRLYVMDREQRLLPIGIVGELCLGEPGLARGYLNRDEQTRSVFIRDPYGSRLYRTGDLARWDASGNIELVGRMNNQVKIRGFRVELGEIEAAIAQLGEVHESVVLAVDMAEGKRLVAYVEPNAGATVDVAALRTILAARLPEHMVPSLFMLLPRLPVTPNGKLDRRSLPAPDWSQQVAAEYIAPRTALETSIAQVWSDVLGVERVSIHDNFFDLGGHSLLATKVVARLRELTQAELPLRALFASPTVAGIAEALAQASRSELPALVHTARSAGELLPLSFAQQRLWLIDQLAPGSALYNIPLAVKISGRLDIAALQQSLGEIVRRHDSLRTRFVTDDNGEARQIIEPFQGLPLPQARAPADAQQLQQQVFAFMVEPFRLDTAPLLRLQLLELPAANEYILLACLHHIITDGWSMDVLLTEIAALYPAFAAGQPSPLPALSVQYADFALWQQQVAATGYYQRQLDYWKQQLANVPVLQLPTDKLRPALLDGRGRVLQFVLDKQLATATKQLAQSNGATLYQTLLAAFQLLLARYSGQDDIAVGTPVANRQQAALEPIIGFFVNTLVMRAQIDTAQPFTALLAQVRNTTVEAYQHQDQPFEQLIEALRVPRDLSNTPLFQVMFILQGGDSAARLNQGTTLGDITLSSVQDAGLTEVPTKFDLTLSISERDGALHGELEYRSSLWHEASMRALGHHFETLLRAIVAEPARAVGEYPLLTGSEMAALMTTSGDSWNATQHALPEVNALHTLIEQQVVLTPAASAVSYNDSSWSYDELNRRANQLAHYLRQLGVGPGALVGVCLERSLEMSLALLATLKAGAAYVPFDPTFPADRLGFMLDDTDVTVMLTATHLTSVLPAQPAHLLCLDRDAALWQAQPESNPISGVGSDNLFNVIFTSGSTGKPKGVMVPHIGIINRLLWMQHRYPLAVGDRVLQKTPYSFDVSVWELFWPLLVGAEIVYAKPEGHKDPDYLCDIIQRERIDTLHFVPSMLGIFLQNDNVSACTSIKRVFCSGEALQLAHEKRFFEKLPHAELHNLYGPTEASVDVSYYACGPDSPYRSVPIGKPVWNTQLHVLDARLQPVPVGVVGELYIGGIQLAHGYLKRDELTRTTFIDNPHYASGHPSKKLYKTGDLARYLPDGNIEYIGRIDFQVKVRGLRIELGEIETVLMRHPLVKESIITVQEISPGSVIVVAYFVPRNNSAIPDAQALRAFLQQDLPVYMLPNVYMPLDEIPLSANGKANRKALPVADLSQLAQREYVAPRTALEQSLADIFAGALGCEKVGIHDNFFELGGHSLTATQIMARVKAQLQLQLEVRHVFETPTVAELAAHLEGQLQQQTLLISDDGATDDEEEFTL